MRTRLSPDFGKFYFIIADFRENARNFAADDFDWPPIQDQQFGEDDDMDVPAPDNTDQTDDEDVEEPGTEYFDPDNEQGGGDIAEGVRRKITVNGADVTVLNQRVEYYGADGRLTTQSLDDYTKTNILNNYASLDHFLIKWQAADKKQAIIKELKAQGILLSELQELISKELDPFDLICYLAFDMPPLSRKERAKNVKKRNYFAKYGENFQKVLENLLEKYSDEGIENIESLQVLKLDPLNAFWHAEGDIYFFSEIRKIILTR